PGRIVPLARVVEGIELQGHAVGDPSNHGALLHSIAKRPTRNAAASTADRTEQTGNSEGDAVGDVGGRPTVELKRERGFELRDRHGRGGENAAGFEETPVCQAGESSREAGTSLSGETGPGRESAGEIDDLRTARSRGNDHGECDRHDETGGP